MTHLPRTLARFLAGADDVLRRRPGTAVSAAQPAAVLRLAGHVTFFGMFYGAAMGTLDGLGGDRIWQVAFSSLKVPILLLVTFLIGLPTFVVLNSLFGLRRDCGEAVRAVVAAQAGLAIVLAALAPLTLVWYASSADYQWAVRGNGLMFAVASLCGQKLLRDYYAPLIRRNRRHRTMLWTWLAIYVLVGIQMAWVLRPFVGAPGAPVQFVRPDSWGNAYDVVARLIWEAVVR